MKIKLDSFKVDETNPFHNDLFEREIFAGKLQNVVKNNKDKLVICLNGEWGVGKTTFLKMWEKQLDIDNIPNLYLDAFENDYTEDAFFFIASAIDELVQKSSRG